MKKLKYTDHSGYILPEKRQYIGTVNDPLVSKINELVDAYNKLINKPAELTNGRPTICECCKTEPAATAKGMFENCSKYW